MKAHLVLSGMNTYSINRKLRLLHKLGWTPITDSINFTRTHVRNDVTLIVKGDLENHEEAFEIVENDSL